ncbi:hypothetical protein SCHPADRAFT_947594 [Schizopora paradoxa]|uniref:Uncharacterized protein n=1 Tax=Schizopora paradoxa TaxID=27342 RepID=A0A0H2QYD9_9AGAM|nr:hypothetical protein SCHPADRAFT_947594 [Schizopora paradoxa]
MESRSKRSQKPSQKVVEATIQIVEAPPPKRPRGRPPKNKVTQKPKAVNPTEAVGATEATGKASKKRKAAQRDVNPAPAKAKKQNKSQAKLTDGDFDRMRAKFYGPEPSLDDFAETVTNGLADGTLLQSDSEYEEAMNANDDLSDFDELYVTSTPFPRKKAKTLEKVTFVESEDENSTKSVKVQVHDGVALTQMTVSTTDSYLTVLQKMAAVMQRPTPSVKLAYEAAWSQKIGTKKCPAYVTSDQEMANFWAQMEDHKTKIGKGKPKSWKITDESLGITFRNMLAEAQKSTGRAKDAPTNKPSKKDANQDAKDSALGKVTDSTEEIQEGMFCTDCNRVCYKTWDNKCRPYTHEYMAEHAKLLAAGEPGVVANKVPHVMHSKVLDYVRPGRKPASFRTAPGDRDEEMPDPPPNLIQAYLKTHAVERAQVREFKGAHDFPLISSWLRSCEDHLERGRDKHEYSNLAPLFAENGCTRIDDIARMTTSLIRELAAEAGIQASIGLVLRVHDYAVEDVTHIKKFGMLS